MTDRELMQDALEAMESAIQSGDWKVDGACDPDAVLNRLRNRLAQPEPWVKTYCGGKPNYTTQPEPQPVAWLSKCYSDDNEDIGYTLWDKDVGSGCFPVYKEARGWVELTEYEFEEILAKYNEALPMVVCRAIEAKLKEKNT
jgi:hypothetical protein